MKKDYREAASIIRSEIMTRFVEPRTKQLCVFPWVGREACLPTPQELADGIPNPTGYSTGFADAALFGGILLNVICDEYAVTGDPALRDQARIIFSGLCRLAHAGDPPGFVPRWVHPDGRSCYPDSSGDQHTLLPCGLWRYFKSGIPTEDERADIGSMVDRIVSRIEADGWRITTRRGKNAHAGGSLEGNSAAVSLFSLLMAAHATSGKSEWLEIYEEKAGEKGGARLKGFFEALFGGGKESFLSHACASGPVQIALKLRLLAESDPCEERRKMFRDRMVELAARFFETQFPRPPESGSHWPRYSEGTRRRLGDAVVVPSPFDLSRFRPELWGAEEDLTWRADFKAWGDAGNDPKDKGPYILWWYGKRPVFCHERNCVQFPLTAFHLALLSGDKRLTDRIQETRERLFTMVDFRKCCCLETLIEGLAACVECGS